MGVRFSERVTDMKVFLFPNYNKKHSRATTSEACDILNSLGCEVILPLHCREYFPNSDYTFVDIETGTERCDVMISVGGDGTILRCAKYASEYGKELLGINCGRLGFMATLEREELSQLKKLVDGDYHVDQRMMLEVSVAFENGAEKSLTALNEAVISSGYGSGIHDFTVLANGLTVSSLRADGLIFSTPTGASAYSLSAGGPLIEPTLDCIEFTQICPHSLFARTMVFSPDKTIEVRFKADKDCAVILSVDGQEPIRLSEKDRITIKRSEQRLKLIDIRGDGYFRAINHKLMQPAKETEETI